MLTDTGDMLPLRRTLLFIDRQANQGRIGKDRQRESLSELEYYSQRSLWLRRLLQRKVVAKIITIQSHLPSTRFLS